MAEKDVKNPEIQVQRRPQQAQEAGKLIQLIIFQLGDEEFGSDIAQVREIIRKGSITPIPDSPDFIQGVTNVRGEIAVVIDLKKRFFLPAKKDVEEKHIVMTEQDNNLFGLMVDEVSEVLRIPQADIKTTPELVTRIDRIYISGVLTLENRLIMMLDLQKVLSEEELEKLSEIRLRHRATIEKAEEKRTKVEEVKAKDEEAKAKEPKVEKAAEPATAKTAKKSRRGRK